MGQVGAATPTASATGGRIGETRRALALFFLFAAFYCLTASGHFYAIDEEILYDTTTSIVERHTLALPAGMWYLSAITQEPAANRPVYSPYMPGQPLIAVPLYLLGRAVAALFPAPLHGYLTRFVVGLLGPLVTAATVALLYRLARVLGYRSGPALGLAVSYGLATLAWPHGRTFFAEPLTAFLTLVAFYGLCRATHAARQRVSHGWLVGAGAVMVLALVVKPHAALLAPIFALYLLGRLITLYRAGEGRLAWRGVVAGLLAWAAGVGLVAAPLAVYTTLRYGGIVNTGYGAPTNLVNPAIFPYFAPAGLYGLTLSTGKGLLWYAPPVLLALGGWGLFWRRHHAEALACLGIVPVNIWFYSRIPWWHGDGSWGPRYLTIALPIAIIPLVALLEWVRDHPVWRALAMLVITLGVVVQLLGVLVNFDWYILRSDETARHFSPAASPILAHARLLIARTGEWRARLFPPPDTAVLTNGFSYSEGNRAAGELFPRWTTGAGEITLHAGAVEPLLVKLTFFDHRPPALRRQQPTVELNGQTLPESVIERRDFSGTGEGWIYQFTVPAAALHDGQATVTLRSATWNPRAVGQSNRDEELGVFVHNVEVWRVGQPWQVREALPLPPLPDTPRWRFWWFNDDRAPDDTRHHLVDLWLWYVLVAGFSRGTAAAWIATYLAWCALLFLLGLLVLRPRLGWSWPARRQQRRRTSRRSHPAPSTRPVLPARRGD